MWFCYWVRFFWCVSQGFAMKFTVKNWLNDRCNRKYELLLTLCVSLDPYLFSPCTVISLSSVLLSVLFLNNKKRFLRCSPFDDFQLWKSQVDNGSKKGGERLSILTKSLLLRRTKDQLDSTGKPLVIISFIRVPEGGWGRRVACPLLGSNSHLLCWGASECPICLWGGPRSSCVTAVLFLGQVEVLSGAWLGFQGHLWGTYSVMPRAFVWLCQAEFFFSSRWCCLSVSFTCTA